MSYLPLKVIGCLSILLLSWALPVYAQVFSNDEGAREAVFVTKVMQLDEFIHRFNNDPNSTIRQYYLAHHRKWDKSRAELIRSLFDYSQDWNAAQMDLFIRRATDAHRPDSLRFFQDKWYAEAICSFLYNNEPVEATLILRLRVNLDGTAQWMIAAVKPDFTIFLESTAPVVPLAERKLRFIQPAANDTYFAELDRDLADKRYLPAFFDEGFFRRRHSGRFYQALLNDRIRFVTVKKLRYHYLQVHDWIFTVDNYERDTRNSGWLISSIRPATRAARIDYEKRLLEE
ncbi:hypothetical protein [Puia dinghuensis]|uniref:Uncharacterized protein n=1 Tax=Puia dinghuensis TaxID=1792502 RepID=A0A8J2UE29_9BACT|nr:hypothetical protein [Puia dinghuensis]GGB03691.1 hypothetical protein GCM10011511_28730 [Puia dinghuensis]